MTLLEDIVHKRNFIDIVRRCHVNGSQNTKIFVAGNTENFNLSMALIIAASFTAYHHLISFIVTFCDTKLVLAE